MLIDKDNIKGWREYLSFLIINALRNTVVKDCFQIPSTVDSARTEACELSSFCAIMVFSERYLRSVHSSIILLSIYDGCSWYINDSSNF